MLLSPVIAAGIRDGSVTAVFRRWDAPRVRPGGTQRTSAGVVRFDAVEPVEMAELTEEDAHGAGMASLAELVKANQRGRGSQLYRIRVSFDRPDERVALRDTVPSPADGQPAFRRAGVAAYPCVPIRPTSCRAVSVAVDAARAGSSAATCTRITIASRAAQR